METRTIRKIAGVSFTTALLYNLGLLSPFFAIPLQYTAAGKSRTTFLISSLFSVCMILCFRFMVLNPLQAWGFLYLDAYVLLLAIAGLYLNSFVLEKIPMAVRLTYISFSAAVLTLLLWPFASGFKDQIIMALDQVLILGQELSLSTGDIPLDGESFFLILQDMAGTSAMLWYYFFLVLTCFIGSKLGRSGDTDQNEDWKLPEYWVWFLFIPLTLYLLDKLLSQRSIQLLGLIPYYAVSNLLLVISAGYGLRGLMIIKEFLKLKGVSPVTQRMLLMSAGFLIVIPGVNLAMFICIAGLGVSELWVNYRIFNKE